MINPDLWVITLALSYFESSGLPITKYRLYINTKLCYKLLQIKLFNGLKNFIEAAWYHSIRIKNLNVILCV